MGNLNLQLHCDLVPLACENFLTLCETGYYKNTIFHRNIRHFMIQGGDPSATGRGGKSIWNKEFPDEFIKSLKHDGAGVLSMANYGKNTNTSQFFICYKSAPHLNNKHTVFGKLVGGMDVLKGMALMENDLSDKPLTDIVILESIVYLNPFSKEEMEKEEQEEKLKKEKEKRKTRIRAMVK
jgi:peptidyl-prolyl cis-trans isomerase-like protein 2